MAGPRGSDAPAGTEALGISNAMAIVHPRMRGTGTETTGLFKENKQRASSPAKQREVLLVGSLVPEGVASSSSSSCALCTPTIRAAVF